MSLARNAPDRRWRIGIDFDNTIVGYDEVFSRAAAARGLIPAGFTGTKQAVRDAIRLLPEGESAWQKLQGYVYGQGVGEAVMFAGVDRFVRRCHEEGHTVLIVSHKTEFGHYDPARVNLRQAALGWLAEHRFFAADGCALPPENVFFETTREEKIRRIAALGCTHFIDDLEEVLDDPAFPAGVERVLFSDAAETARAYPRHATWPAIERALFHVDA
jgi:hypothetical protein